MTYMRMGVLFMSSYIQNNNNNNNNNDNEIPKTFKVDDLFAN